MRNRVRNGRWQRAYRGVYQTYTGNSEREAQLWAAVLRAGSDAVLSHQTAAERHGLISKPGEVIHITVPVDRHPARHSRIPGVVIHRSDSVFRTRHPVMTPPCTRVEDTVLDLIACAQTFDEAYDWICKAVGRRRTTPERLLVALGSGRDSAGGRKHGWR